MNLAELVSSMNAQLGDLRGEPRRKEIRRMAGLGISSARDEATRRFWASVYRAMDEESARCEAEARCTSECANHYDSAGRMIVQEGCPEHDRRVSPEPGDGRPSDKG